MRLRRYGAESRIAARHFVRRNKNTVHDHRFDGKNTYNGVVKAKRIKRYSRFKYELKWSVGCSFPTRQRSQTEIVES